MLKPMFLILSIILFFNINQELFAAKKKKARKSNTTVTAKYADIVIDVASGDVLRNTNADEIRHPASLTKLMTLYLTFEAIENGKLNLDEKLEVSYFAASQARLNISLKVGEKISVRDLIKSLVVVSANDSAVVLAEKLGVTEKNFAIKMTDKAKQLGMNKTVFRNASGLPDDKQVTTARDMATLMIALQSDFPDFYEMLSELVFVRKGVTYKSHTNVMKVCSYAKAGKTGYVRASGFNLVIGAEKGERQLVAVVMGGVTAKARDDKMLALLNQYF